MIIYQFALIDILGLHLILENNGLERYLSKIFLKVAASLKIMYHDRTFSGEKSNDLLSRLLRAKDDEGRTLNDESLFGQIGGFLFAGFEVSHYIKEPYLEKKYT